MVVAAQPFVVSANEQGRTIYGYEHAGALSFNDYSHAYQTDHAQYMQQADRHAQHSLELSQKAVEGFKESAHLLAKDAARIAAIQAAGQATADAIRAAVEMPHEDHEHAEAEAEAIEEPAPSDDEEPAPVRATIQADPFEGAGQLGIVLANKCAKCHRGDTAKGGFDVTHMTEGDYELILDRVTTADATKRMPKGSSLTPAEMRAVVREVAK